MDKDLNVSELRKMAEESLNKPVERQHDYSDEETKVVGNDWMNSISTESNNPVEKTVPVPEEKVKDIVEKPIIENTSTPESPKEEYNGPGLVVTEDEIEADKEPVREYTGITPNTQAHIDEYLANMDAEIEQYQRQEEEMKKTTESEDEEENEDLVSMFSDESEEDEEEENAEMTESEFKEKYDEAVVLIDKTNFGAPVIDFTDEEREKLEKAKSIKLEEVETIELGTLKTKKIKKKKDLNNIIKKIATSNTTNVVLPYSGYTATMKGCSAYELVTLINTSESSKAIDIQNRWSLIHSKIDSTSIGKMNFTEFMRNTASQDYDTLLYGIMCSTYPDEDKMEITCRKCGNKYEHAYLIRSLLRVEEMSDELKDVIMKTVDNSFTEETAKEWHEQSPVCAVTRIKLPVSGIICDIGIRSMYDNLNNIISELNNKENAKYEDALVQSVVIRAMYIPDEEANDGSYFEIENGLDIAKTVYNLNKVDSDIILKKSMDEIKDLSPSYGLMNMKCPHCGDFVASENVDLSLLLFYLNRQAMDINVR